MRIFSRSTIEAYGKKYADAREPLRLWFKIAEKAQWRSPNDVKTSYPSASVINSSRVVFNIKKNSYRLIVDIRYDKQRLFIRFFGTHAAYDKVDAAKV